ncbi:MAG: DUF1493 family protein [Sphingomonadales bacterium]|jgi:hypothetical protein
MLVDRNYIENEMLRIIRGVASKSTQISLTSRLLHDLGVYGDDAWYMFDNISEAFDIKDALFDGTEYFPNEHEFPGFITRLLNKNALDEWKEMTVSQLVDLIAASKVEKASQ